jgi:hypothetical protein
VYASEKSYLLFREHDVAVNKVSALDPESGSVEAGVKRRRGTAVPNDRQAAACSFVNTPTLTKSYLGH